MVSELEIRKHYLEGEGLKLPPEPSRKQYKLALKKKGKFLRIKTRIKDINKFRKELLRLEGKRKLRIGQIRAVYWGTVSWSDPTKVSTLRIRQGYKIADRLVVRDVLPLDIDSDGTIEGLNKARKTALKLLNWIDKKGLELIWINWSGSSGFHLPCYGPKLPANAENRMDSILHTRKVYYEELQKESISVCRPTFMDPGRILKIIGSADPDTGLMSTLLTREQLNTPFPQLFKNINTIGEKNEEQTQNPKRPSEQEEKPQKQSRMFFTDKIVGIKDSKIIILKYERIMGLKKLTKQIEKLAQQYQASDWHVFKTQRHYYVINLRSYPQKRHQKIKNASDAQNTKNKTSFFPITEQTNEKGEKTDKPPQHILTIKGKKGKNKGHHSKAHTIFLQKKYGIKTKGKTHGKPTLCITHTRQYQK